MVKTINTSIIFCMLVALAMAAAPLLFSENVFSEEAPAGKEKVISVLKFEDRSIGTKDFQPWTMGIPDMIMQSMGAIPDYKVISREYIVKQVLKEQEFQLLGVTDYSNAVKMGKVLNAQYVVIGSYQVFKGMLSINAKVIDIESGQIIFQAISQGGLDNFNEVQNQIAIRIAQGMNVSISEEEKRRLMMKFDTRDMNASLANYQGEEKLEVMTVLKKQNKNEEAKQKAAEAKSDFKKALEFDSGYNKAKKNLMKTMQAMPMTL